MGCGSSCGSCGTTTENGTPKGCRSNGSCQTGGCNKLDVFDWLGDMGLPHDQLFPIVEVRFKGNRKGFYRVPEGLEVITGQAVVVDVPNGHHLGYVSLQGELVRLQMRKKKVVDNEENVRKIYRTATVKDIEMFNEVKERENPTMYRTRQIIQEMKLKMKLSDVEYQSDNVKATFYYSADERVDFRDLIKMLASEFRVRVEMRQISLRQEAGRLGGIGSCGRELCCSTWLTDFKSVTTMAARYQNLSLNPGKLSGQCGRLKCCLNYELQTYMDALNDIPKLERPLETQKGRLTLQKTDIFRKIMWFSYPNENTWVAVSVDRVNEVIELNSKDVKPEVLVKEKVMDLDAKPDWQNDLSLEEGTIPEEKTKRNSRKRRNNRKKKGEGNPNQRAGNQQQRKPKNNRNPSANQNNRKNQNQEEGKKSPAKNTNRNNNPKRPNKPQNNRAKTPQKQDEQRSNSNQNTPQRSNNPKRPNRNRPNNPKRPNNNRSGGNRNPNNRNKPPQKTDE